MINLRYHIVSLVAVFLALAVGILMGSTVLDRGTVALLERSSGQLRGNLDSYRAENTRFDRELRQWRRYGELVLPGQVAGRLRGHSVLVVDTDQVADGAREAVRQAVRAAGASYDGRITFSSQRLTLEEPADRSALAGLLDTGEQDRAVLQRLLVDKVAGRLRVSVALPRDERDRAGDPLTALRQANFIADLDIPAPFRDGGQPFPRLNSLVVVLGPPAGVEPVPAPDGFLVPVAGRLATISPTPVAAVETSGPLAWLQALRRNELVSARVSTVDNVDLVPGQVALVEALARGLAGQPAGHYGNERGATELLPEAPAS
ncbi:MAG TPA: copper transporter [Actinomycetes bacterium]|nr:copper transporter [Actinomycetes bacterium]